MNKNFEFAEAVNDVINQCMTKGCGKEIRKDENGYPYIWLEAKWDMFGEDRSKEAVYLKICYLDTGRVAYKTVIAETVRDCLQPKAGGKVCVQNNGKTGLITKVFSEKETKSILSMGLGQLIHVNYDDGTEEALTHGYRVITAPVELKYKECSLFDVNLANDNLYVLAHCISSDFGMGAGIVVMFNNLYRMKEILKSRHENLSDVWGGNGYCLAEHVKGDSEDKTNVVCNLVTKQFVCQKPTYKTLRDSLEHMKMYMMSNDQKKLAIPLIGCGIDGLKWPCVEAILKDVFANTGIEILVCYLEKDRPLLGSVLLQGYEECFKAIEEAMREEPVYYEPFTSYFHIEKLELVQFKYGNDLYKECYEAVCAKHDIS